MKHNLSKKYLTPILALVSGSSFLFSIAGCAPTPGEGADPGIVDIPIAYVKRTIPVDNNNEPIQPDISDPTLYSAGGDLFIRMRSSQSAQETNLTSSMTNGIGDVKDVESSYDGKKLVFSMKIDDPDTAMDDNTANATWNIYEYDSETGLIRRVIFDDAKAVGGDDIAPHYLPDGRIVFSSNRQKRTREVLINESGFGISDREVFSHVIEENNSDDKAFGLHVMKANGEDITQISFNQSHDLDPVVLNDGNILFSRWDNTGNNNEINLYTSHPDGSKLNIYYGAHSVSHLADDNVPENDIQFTQPRVLPDGTIMVVAKPFTDTYGGGDILIIDGENYIDIDQPTRVNEGILSGAGQVKATVTNVVNVEGAISIAGRYSAAYPLRDGTNRILVSKGTCQVTTDDITDPNITVTIHPCIEPYLSDPNVFEMPSNYGIWMYDRDKGTELPIVVGEVGKYITDVVAMQPQPLPPVIVDKVFDPNDPDVLADVGAFKVPMGILNIRSVYDFGNAANTFDGCFTPACGVAGISSIADLADGAVDNTKRQARFLRISKAVGIAADDDPELSAPFDIDRDAFGRNRNLGMKEIIGYTMVEPDGSVRVKVPADIAFSIEVLDGDGLRIGQRHDNWLQVNPGDELKCNGCHVHTTGVKPNQHGRIDEGEDEIASSLNQGATGNGIQFPNTINPDTTPESAYLTSYQNTMAEVRTITDPTALLPTVDLIYADKWTDVTNMALVPDTPFSYLYSALPVGLQSPEQPAKCRSDDPAVDGGWNGLCRIIINYLDHIEPMWALPREDPNQATPNTLATCTNCHSPVNEVAAAQVPQAQLNLITTASIDEPNHSTSYRELFFNDEPDGLDMNDLVIPLIVDQNVPRVDGMGNPVLDANGIQIIDVVKIFNPLVVTPDTSALLISSYLDGNGNVIQIPATMNSGSARNSHFMEIMLGKELDSNRSIAPAVAAHKDFMSRAELKVIAEWLDIGAQYFNAPFDNRVPMN